ncbi:MAG: oligosaccharide flippase family protein [Dysgonamonadaceae bacterium]|jgi:O-antigen/teichoic acid export membrane protein|nr:oligosaccharide flippase family protein [Dysgonamonadaceae bacterium]
MAEGMKSLAKDTAIYGISSILGKTLNWLLTPLFTYTLATTGEYGIVTYLYAYLAAIIIILTFGMETGLFRFANKKNEYNPATVYSTTLIGVGSVVGIFLLLALLFLQPATRLISDQIPESYILMMTLVLSMDAFCSIPFAWLRYKQRPVKFAALKMLFIVLYIGFCCFFLVACPAIYEHHPELIDWFYSPDFQVGYILLSNLMATFIQSCCLLPELWGFRYTFDKMLFRKMLRFSLPLLILGLAGTLSQTADKIIFPWIYPDKAEAMEQLGVYGACFKIAVIMVMFTQAFRYAYEPFIFAKNNNKDHKEVYAEAMKYFIIFGLLIFLGVMFYLDLLKFFFPPTYYAGLAVVPIVMMGELFFGIYFNLSLWYKLTDKTYWGAIFSVAGSILIITLNVLFIPKFGYMACAWASFAGYLFVMLVSYFVGQRQYKIAYDLRSAFLYMGLAAVLYTVSVYVDIDDLTLRLLFRSGLLAVYAGVLLKRDLPLANIR